MERGERRCLGRGDGRGRMETRPTHGVAMGHARKRGERATGGREGRQERRPEGPLCNVRQGGDARPPWGRAGARGKKRRPAGLGKSRTLGSAEKLWVEPKFHGVGEEEGGRKATGVEENPGGGATEWAGGRIVSGRLDPQRKGWRSRVVERQLDPKWIWRGGRVVSG